MLLQDEGEHTAKSHQFTVMLESRSGALAELLEALAARGIDLRTIGVNGIERLSSAVLMTDNDSATHHVRCATGYALRKARLVVTSVPDEAGVLAGLLRRLADAGIGLHSLLLPGWHQGKADLALSVDDPAARLRHVPSACASRA